MSSIDAVECIFTQLQTATNYIMIFGVLPPGDIAEQKAGLRQKFTYLAFQVHSDYAPKEIAKKADKTFRMLNEFRRGAEAAIEAGTYDQPFTRREVSSHHKGGDKRGFELQSASRGYRFSSETFHLGDFAVLYRGHTLDEDHVEVVVKIASDPRNNAWLEREAQVLMRFRSATGGRRLSGIKAYVPKLLDTFLVPGKGGMRFRANVMRYVPDLVSITQIIEAYPDGLNPQDAAWVCRRIIAQTLAASMVEVIHGALVPDHILVDPFSHEPLHIGWAHAIDDPRNSGKRMNLIIDRFRDFYPPEVLARELPSHRSDIFMAGKTMVKLLGGDVRDNSFPEAVPKEVVQVILRCVQREPARRFKSGREALDEFTRVIRSLWGKAYRPLAMPIR